MTHFGICWLIGLTMVTNACGTAAPADVTGSGPGTGGSSTNSGATTSSVGGAPTTAAKGGASSTISGRYLPLVVGARWTYRAVDAATGVTGETSSVIEAYEDVGGVKAGVMAYRVKSTLLAGGSTINWQQDLATSVVRHREQFLDSAEAVSTDYIFKPNRMRLDESPTHLLAGANWTETNSADIRNRATGASATGNYTVAWTVEAMDEAVTVPSGTYSCLRVRRVQTGYSSSDEVHWYARGVGKVKEAGPENKELIAFTIP